MKITIRGADYDIDPANLTLGEAKRIESVTGKTFSQWGAELAAGSVGALQALIWTLMRRSDPELRFDQVDDIAFGEVVMEEPEPEKKPARAGRGRQVDPTRTA